MQYFNVESALSLSSAIIGKPSKNYAQLANLVFKAAEEEQDNQAQLLVNECIDYVTKMANKLLEFKPPRMSMIGGISSLILSRLDDDLALKFEKPLRTPEIGALIFAKQNWMRTNE